MRAREVARDGEPPLRTERYEIELTFIVADDVGGGLSIDFPPFEAGFSGSVAESNVQKLKLAIK